MSKRKVLDVKACGECYKGYYEEGKKNPWRLYRVTWEQRKDGYGMSQHNLCVGKWNRFGDMIYELASKYGYNVYAWKEEQ